MEPVESVRKEISELRAAVKAVQASLDHVLALVDKMHVVTPTLAPQGSHRRRPTAHPAPEPVVEPTSEPPVLDTMTLETPLPFENPTG